MQPDQDYFSARLDADAEMRIISILVPDKGYGSVTDRATLNPMLTLPEGTLLSLSDWLLVTQEMNDAFGAATFDPDPLHNDPDWAARNGPFGGTIAYGFYTMSLMTHLMRSKLAQNLMSVENGLFLNYGFDKLRLISPVPIGKRIRGRFIAGPIREDKGGRLIRTFHATVEVEGEDKPAVAAEWLTAWVPPADGGGTKIAA